MERENSIVQHGRHVAGERSRSESGRNGRKLVYKEATREKRGDTILSNEPRGGTGPLRTFCHRI